MRKFTYIDCPVCGKEFQSLGYASHRAMHGRQREKAAKKLQQPPVINQVCLNPKYAKETVCVKFNDDGSCSPCGFCKQTCL